MGKSVLILAPIIIGVAVLGLVFWLGRVSQRAQSAVLARNISPSVHADLVQYVRDLLNPTDLADVPYLPSALRERGESVLKDVDYNLAAVRRAERRRAGFF